MSSIMKIATICLLLICIAVAQETEEIVYEEPTLEPLPTPPPREVPEPEPLSAPSVQKPREPFKLDMRTLKTYQNEALVIAAVFFYLIMYVRGKAANVKLMERFYRKLLGCLENNFAHIGFTKISGEAPFNGESPSESTYYATGRDNVENIEIKFNVTKLTLRQRNARTFST